MKYIFSIIVAIALVSPLCAQTRQTVVIADFKNVSDRSSAAHYATIVPDNIRTEIDRTGFYTVKRVGLLTGSVSDTGNVARVAGRAGADFMITGEYRVKGNSVGVSAYLYIREKNEIVTISMEPKRVGVFLNEIIDNVSIKLSFELQKYRDRSETIPKIELSSSGFGYYADLILTPHQPGVPVYYTLDGSVPGVTSGRRYGGSPITLYDHTVVKAVSLGEDGIPSDVAVKKYLPPFSVNMFEVRFLYGYMQFIDTHSGDVDSILTSNAASVVPVFYLGAFNSLKKTPLIRNVGLGGWFDFASADLKDGYQYKMQGMSGGLFFKFYPFSNFTLEIPVTAGMMNISVVEKSEFYDGMFTKPDDTIASDSDIYVNTGFMGSFIFSHFQLTTSCTMRYVLTDGDHMKILVYQAGAGFGF
ncbi:MAG: chitobiase/beta-hexosaminidase C-terminal domain-containing protein [Spirochaetes bacterium]|jgi:TolB-like protein|nr:chitobiase/beta-hexosaminidase C-terminal domain-containing protein [Spirochaetota bacterium]